MASKIDSLLQDREETGELTGWIFDVQRYSINDGPGIRTTVFFKGCPLGCLWCDNPESQCGPPQLFYFDSLCTRCYRCVKACPNGASTIDHHEAIQINRQLCKACGACVEACLSEARAMSGKRMTVDSVLEIVKKDLLFYRNSGGGVTASGGEATFQPEFLLQFFRRCQERGIHTTLDTCGYVKWEVLEKILDYTDLLLFDIKHMDRAKHIELTGVDNAVILDNAKRIAKLGKPMRIRVPLIPGCNDSEQNVEQLARFTLGLGLKEIDLLPYHKLGINKYERLGIKYELTEIDSFQEERIEEIKKHIESYGAAVVIA